MLKQSKGSDEKVALLRDLTTGPAYRFKVVAYVSKYGESEQSLPSAEFHVTAEVPDKPPLIYFERSSTLPYSSVNVTVVVGSVNGAPIDEYTLEYWEEGESSTNPATVSSTTSNSFELDDLTQNTAFNFRSKIKNSVGYSEEYSDEFGYSTTKIEKTIISFVGPGEEPDTFEDRSAKAAKWYGNYTISLKVKAGETSGIVSTYRLLSKVLEDGDVCDKDLIPEMESKDWEAEGYPQLTLEDARQIYLRNKSYTARICYCAEVLSKVGATQKTNECYEHKIEDEVRSCAKTDWELDIDFQLKKEGEKPRGAKRRAANTTI